MGAKSTRNENIFIELKKRRKLKLILMLLKWFFASILFLTDSRWKKIFEDLWSHLNFSTSLNTIHNVCISDTFKIIEQKKKVYVCIQYWKKWKKESMAITKVILQKKLKHMKINQIL
jgi:hypothetical protein